MPLGHIVSKEGIAMDPNKVKAILEAPAPYNANALSRFLGQIRWHIDGGFTIWRILPRLSMRQFIGNRLHGLRRRRKLLQH
jgi:hypothetical protein